MSKILPLRTGAESVEVECRRRSSSYQGNCELRYLGNHCIDEFDVNLKMVIFFSLTMKVTKTQIGPISVSSHSLAQRINISYELSYANCHMKSIKILENIDTYCYFSLSLHQN